jgi:hypothetical protein
MVLWSICSLTDAVVHRHHLALRLPDVVMELLAVVMRAIHGARILCHLTPDLTRIVTMPMRSQMVPITIMGIRKRFMIIQELWFRP